jgi:ribosomal protein S24E
MLLRYNMEKQSDIRNNLFKRNEMIFVLETDKNPGFDESLKLISKQIGKPEEEIEVFGINGSFGTNRFVIDAHVYDSAKDLKKSEQKTQKQKIALKEESKKAYEESKKTKETVKEVKEEAKAEA